MPAPAAPVISSLTAKGSSFGAATLEWTHAGTTKYEVLAKVPYETSYRSLHIADAAHFGAGPYTMEVPLTDGIKFAVKAINSSGEASVKSNILTSTLSVEGVWLLPWADHQIVDTAWAWLGGPDVSPEMSQERDGQLLVPPSREEAINVTTGIIHKGVGDIDGLLHTRHGLSGNDWRERLTNLVRDQKSYRWVWLASSREMFKVELVGPVTRKTTVAGVGAAYTYSVGIREL